MQLPYEVWLHIYSYVKYKKFLDNRTKIKIFFENWVLYEEDSGGNFLREWQIGKIETHPNIDYHTLGDNWNDPLWKIYDKKTHNCSDKYKYTVCYDGEICYGHARPRSLHFTIMYIYNFIYTYEDIDRIKVYMIKNVNKYDGTFEKVSFDEPLTGYNNYEK